MAILEVGLYVHSLSLVFFATIDRGETIKTGGQATDVKLSDVLPENTLPFHKMFIQKYAKELKIKTLKNFQH